ncbi:hypothetical protein WR25_07505 [Diploscapter pachys]|uniref:Uncharacterized protein n=1 Tax=Diploscapter pachys TaxID=2018661 RepID=A0A2A2JK37_9BILA|nr:hypothetical protein WR25_07505 [Diploscapter pachys]
MDPVVTDADQDGSDIPPTEEPKPEQDAEALPQNDEFCFKAPLPPIKRGKRGRGAANISIVHSPAARRNGHISAENSTSPPRRGHKSGRGGSCRGPRGGLSRRMARTDGQFTAQKASGASGRGRGGRGGANRLVRQDTLPFQTSEEGQNPAALQPVKKVIRVRVNGKYRVRTRVGARVAARMQAARQSAIEKSKKGRGKKAYDLALKKSKRGLGLKASDLTDPPNGAGSDIPPPPPLKFVKHDMFCPMTQNYLEKLTDLPKFASIPKWLHNWIDYRKKHLAGRWIVKARKRIEQMKRDKRRKQTMQLIRATMDVKRECGEEEVESMEIKCEDVSMVDVNERNENGSEVIKCEDGKISENLEKEISKTAQKDPKLEDVVVDDEPCYSKSSESQNVKRKWKRRTAPTFNWLDEKIPFVQEIILDEYSVLGFTSMHDQKIFDDQIEALRLTELDKVKTKKAEKARRCTALRKKIKLRRYVILKYQRQQRKRQRFEKRERQIVERKAKYDTLKKLVKEAIEKDEFSEELRTQWIQIREKRKKRREERRKRKSEHEARKEARRAGRPRRRNGKKRAKERKKKREDSSPLCS